jgi:hypothetical protein
MVRSPGSSDSLEVRTPTHLVAFVNGPSDRGGPRQRVRMEVIADHREACQAFLADLADGMRRLNVYRGHVISLSPGMMGMGPADPGRISQPAARRAR